MILPSTPPATADPNTNHQPDTTTPTHINPSHSTTLHAPPSHAPTAQFSYADLNPIDPWPHPVSALELLDAIVHQLQRFIIFPKCAVETLALWILHTFAFHLRTVTTYVAIESPEKECGKSTLITVLSKFVHRPVISSNISSSAFFRVIEELQPTFLIDEADTNLRGREELRGILNAGYHRPTAFVWRVAFDPLPTSDAPRSNSPPSHDAMHSTLCTPHSGPLYTPHSSAGRLARYSCWCPKAIAAIGRLHETLASRCIVIRMQRKRSDEPCERIKSLNADDLKRQCARFVADHASEIAAAEPTLPTELNNRAADIWEPLIALADLAGGHWPETARQAALGLSVGARDRSPVGSLLLDIFLKFLHAETDRLLSRDLVAALNASTDRPWADLRRGKTLTELWLARQLHPYGIRTRSIRVGDTVGRGYYLDDLQETFKRYIPKSEVEAIKKDLLQAESPPAAPATQDQSPPAPAAAGSVAPPTVSATNDVAPADPPAHEPAT